MVDARISWKKKILCPHVTDLENVLQLQTQFLFIRRTVRIYLVLTLKRRVRRGQHVSPTLSVKKLCSERLLYHEGMNKHSSCQKEHIVLWKYCMAPRGKSSRAQGENGLPSHRTTASELHRLLSWTAVLMDGGSCRVVWAANILHYVIWPQSPSKHHRKLQWSTTLSVSSLRYTSSSILFSLF